MLGQIILARSDETQIRFILGEIGIQHPLLGPYYILVQFLGSCSIITVLSKALSREKILDGMTKMKIQDRENLNIFAGFLNMANFYTANLDPIPLLVGPLITIYSKTQLNYPHFVLKTVMYCSHALQYLI